MWVSSKHTFAKIRKSQRLSQLLILVSFLITFGVTRLVTHLQRDGILPIHLFFGDLHIHHLVPGIILLILSGYFGIAFWSNDRTRQFMAVLFGIGAALTIDEFALWLYLKDVYFERQGRDSIDAVIIFVILISIAYLLTVVHDRFFMKRWGRKIAEKAKLSSSHNK